MKNRRHFHQDRLVPGLLSRQDVSQVALEGNNHVRRAKRHANVAVRRALTPTNARWPEALLRCGPIESWDVDADAQLAGLVRDSSCTGRRATTFVVHVLSLLKFLDCLGDEVLSTRSLVPCALLAEARAEARLHVVPERLPRHAG